MDCGIYFACLASLCLLHSVSAGCAQTLEADKDGYGQCVMGYSMFMGNAASAMDPADPMAMMTVLCSKEGKAAMKCLLDYVETCPDLMTSDNPASQGIFQGFKAMDTFGGLEGYCNMISGPCIAVQQCLASQHFEQDNGTTSPTPLSMMQIGVKNLCGPLKGMFACFKDVGNKCPELEENIKMISKMGNISEAPPGGARIPSYEDSKEFVKKCDQIPKDFATNMCVSNILNSEEFVACTENVTKKYPTKEGIRGCDAYRDSNKCISMSIGKNCGQKYSDAFVIVTPMFLYVPVNCKLDSSETKETSPNTGSSSSIVHVSVATILAAVLAAFQMI